MKSSVSICVIYPDLLGTYGDGGNAVVLSRRLAWRGIDSEVKLVELGDDVPSSCDIYLLGGGEDQPQTSVTERLSQSRALHKAVADGAVVFGVCAGMQILGESFAYQGAKTRDGLGLIDLRSIRGEGARRVGELRTMSEIEDGVEYTGYENHQGISFIGNDARPLAKVVGGAGNDDGKGSEGAVQGRIVTTYMHGPGLVRNPTLADRILQMAVGAELDQLDDVEVNELRKERMREASREFSNSGSSVESSPLLKAVRRLQKLRG